MKLHEGGRVVTSASDLTRFASCEFAFLRALDAALGRCEAVEEPVDAMNERAKALGFVHEAAVLERLRREHADVVELPSDAPTGELAELTLAALRSGAGVIYQGAFRDDDFVGYADFLVRQPDGRYQVQDSKLARSAKVTALMQLAAYADRLARHGFEPHPVVRLVLGDGSVSDHRLADIAPVFQNRWAAMRRAVDARLAADSPIAWDDPAIARDGRCATCTVELERADDLFLVGALRGTQRQRLLAAGIPTLHALAASELERVEGMSAAAFDGLRAQARQQLEPGVAGAPSYRVHDTAPFATLPPPSPGDLFFDFEGDPLYAEPAVASDETRWGLDYLFGFVDAAGEFTSSLAHDLAEEKRALVDFLGDLRRRRERHPDLHVYHYAAYERTHLLSLAARHGVGEDEVDDLLREGVLVDLYPVVRRALRIGERSYSLKIVEKIYRSAARGAAVTTAADSVEEYRRFCELRDAGDAAGAAGVLADILDYNAEDCRSTLELRDWLVSLAAERGIAPTGPQTEPEGEGDGPSESTLAADLARHAGDPLDPDRADGERAWGLASSAIDFHRRERKRYWQEHFTRLTSPLDEWGEPRDVFVVADARVESGWRREPGRKTDRRVVRLTGEWTPGSKGEGRGAFAVYDFGDVLPERTRTDGDPAYRPAHHSTELTAGPDGSLLLTESTPQGEEGTGRWDALPVALTPPTPIGAASLESAIAEWGARALVEAPTLPDDAIADLLRRRPPRTRSGGLAVAVAAPIARDGDGDGDGIADALLASLLDLERSYLAVQGPPGTGKTFTGGLVIARLVREHGWRVGVVAQSHATVENLLRAVARAGIDPTRLLKVGASGPGEGDPPPWTTVSTSAIARRLDGAEGVVVGGTAWAFSNEKQIPRSSLDLLVVDEAGQFSLAATIAAGMSARNLLLLGDPQQLPQVSQAQHPEPVQTSALAHLAEGHDVLPAAFGYFLPVTRRLAPPLAAAVSRLSYDDRLASHPSAAERELAGVAAGVHSVPVVHADDTTSSPAESARVVELVADLVGREWRDPSATHADAPSPRPLTASDVLVVCPYNAQVDLVRADLDAAGFPGTEVGTVDRFQGREKPVAIVSLAASSPDTVPRGLDFLLLRNRLNVAISRALWAAFVVYSPDLVEHLPPTPDGVARLSGFLGLLGGGSG